MPLISDNWGVHFRWRGEGPLPEDQRRRLRDLVDRVHQGGQRIRFWAVPDVPAAWQELHDAGVDYLNTDNLTGLRDFLLNRGIDH